MTRDERQALWWANYQQIRKSFPHKGKIKFIGWYRKEAQQ